VRSPAPSTQGAGLAFAIAAYGLWGLLPIYFLSLEPTAPAEIVAWRIVLSLVFCFLLLTITRGWASLRGTMIDRRAMLLLGLAGALIVVNWLTYVVATLSGHVVEAALGYFLNPIVTVLLGVLVLRERLRPAQWAAIGISAIAALVLAVGYGSVPFVALTLAFSFGFYGLVKKKVGPNVDAIVGLTVETAWLTPFALAGLAILAATTGLTLGTAGTGHTLLLLSAGVITAVPLLFFAAAARRLPLTLIGLTQYLAPLLQFILGVTVLAEPMPLERWIGFALVWVALLVLSVDMFVAGRSPRRTTLEPA
jgi:chloramphenicol-sensitive protein RarD